MGCGMKMLHPFYLFGINEILGGEAGIYLTKRDIIFSENGSKTNSCESSTEMFVLGLSDKT